MIMKEMASSKPLCARPAGPRAAQTGVFPFTGGQWEPVEDVKDTCAAADPFPVLLLVYMHMYVCFSNAVHECVERSQFNCPSLFPVSAQRLSRCVRVSRGAACFCF